LKEKIMRTANTVRTEAVANGNTAKNVALFMAAPFIGLAYAVLLPFVGVAMLLWTAVEALTAALAKIEDPALQSVTPNYQAA
jgi:hypothetical protein